MNQRIDSTAASALCVGLNATILGIGLSRFAYTPLIPALSEQGWFLPALASYLGAANLIGYLIGALTAHQLSEWLGAKRTILTAMGLVTASFVLCASPAAFGWFAFWRFIAGMAGAILMVVGPSLALQYTNARNRPVVATMIFMGIGLGILLSASLMPYLLSLGLSTTWLALGGLSLCAAALGGLGLKRLPARAMPHTTDTAQSRSPLPSAVWLIVIAYGFDAAGFIPHTIFWVDYLTRELAIGRDAALLQWATLGAGAMLGPVIASRLVKFGGWQRALLSAYLLKTLAIVIPVASHSQLWLSLSSFLVGAMIPGIVSLTSGYLAEIVGVQQHKQVWGLATAGFAVVQALSGMAMSAFYDQSGSYAPQFPLAAGLMALGMLAIGFSRHVSAVPHDAAKPDLANQNPAIETPKTQNLVHPGNAQLQPTQPSTRPTTPQTMEDQ
ncbi:YbfB/YjiJ family MFS transporter [Photobacterium atrarenae]|uniref:MFS transporter n=1 Tax=Photobacterium atrarenae TaxID=865757 RepID=A0ABY5GK22_9GAMM|nr:YbfB/YjiJ family MFS transporter [Photobacterium atrarenae]UTV29526.1 MFS transporter [Photobacterium atrarenae]